MITLVCVSIQMMKAETANLYSNILNGDALSLRQLNGEPIIFAEYIKWCLLKEETRLEELLMG